MRAHTCLLYLVAVTVATAAQTKGEYRESDEDVHVARFIKSYSTTTWTFLSSFTSTVPYTCYTTDGTAANNMACTGRRLRRKITLGDAVELKAPHLLPSWPEEEVIAVEVGQEQQQQQRFFTLWRTASTTVTITTFSTNRSVTISVSAMCTVAGLAFNFC